MLLLSIANFFAKVHCSTILKKKPNILLCVSLSIRLSISDSLSFQSSLTPSLQTQNSIATKTPNQCGGVEIDVWGLAQRSVFRCGVEIGIGLWVCRGLRGFRSAWVIGVGLWRSAGGFFFFWVISVVFG